VPECACALSAVADRSKLEVFVCDFGIAKKYAGEKFVKGAPNTHYHLNKPNTLEGTAEYKSTFVRPAALARPTRHLARTVGLPMAPARRAQMRPATADTPPPLASPTAEPSLHCGRRCTGGSR
jgi:hypothetical protein